LFAPRSYIFVLRAHPIRGESHNQRNTTRAGLKGRGARCNFYWRAPVT